MAVTNASFGVRPIIDIIDDWYSTCQYWNSSCLILCLKYRFFTTYITNYICLFSYYLLFPIVILLDLWSRDNSHNSRKNAQFIIFLIINFRRREVSLDRCSVDCHVFLFVVGEDGQSIILHQSIHSAESIRLD